MGLLLAVAGAVFAGTQGMGGSGGPVSPATFPRLAAGVIALLAAFRLLLILTGRFDRGRFSVWAPASFGLPAVIAALMIGYYLLFTVLPFPAITAVFLALAYFALGIRPLWRIALAALLASAVLYVLFVVLLGLSI